MTDITQHSLQNQIVQEEPSINEQNIDSIPEEGDITETVSNIIHVNRTPSPPQDTHERLHQNGGSDSEEDMTEETLQHYDVGNLATNLNNLNTNAIEEPATEEIDTTTSDREQDTVNEEEERQSDIPTIIHEHVEPEQESSDANLVGPTDTVNSESIPAATTITTYSNRIGNNNNNNNNTTSSTNNTSPSSRGRSVSSVSPSSLSSGLLPRSQRVWEMDRQAPECRRCHRRFNFLVRRHHCR